MNISVEKDNGLVVVSASGKLDAVNCGELEEVLAKIVAEGNNKIIFNLDGLIYISSAGLRVLLKTAKKLHGVGTFVLCALSGNVQEIIKISGFSTFMEIFPSASEAKSHLRSQLEKRK